MNIEKQFQQNTKDWLDSNHQAVNSNDLREGIKLMSEWNYLRPVNAELFSRFSKRAWIAAMSFTGIHQLITEELVQFINSLIKGKSAVEVCCGIGTLGRSLNIPFIDRKVQEIPEAKVFFEARKKASGAFNQDMVFPDDVEHMTAYQALKKYDPQWVIGCYVTPKYTKKFHPGSMYGPQEEDFINNRSYIHCGSSTLSAHKYKPINKKEHWVIEADWLFCKSSLAGPSQMRIWTDEQIDFENEIPLNLEFEFYKERL